MRHLTAIAAVALMAGSVSACAGLGSINPFKGEKKDPLPGERHEVMPGSALTVSGGRASVGGRSAMNEWSQPGGNAANDPGNVGLSGGVSASAWEVRALGGLGRRDVRTSSPPLIYGGNVYVYDPSGTVTALSAGGGKLWTTSVGPAKEGRAPGGGIAASGNRIFAATGFGQMIALDAASGNKLWSVDLDAPARSAPTAADGKVFVVSGTSVVHAFNQADGKEAWNQPGIGEVAGVLSSASPAVAGGSVVVPYPSGEVIAFEAASGKMKWTDTVIRPTRTMAVSGITDVAASPVIDNGVVYASGVAGRTVAIRLSDGSRVWEQAVGSSATPVVSGNSVFLVDLQGFMVALDRSSGKIIYRSELPGKHTKRFNTIWTGPTLAGGTLWAVSNDGQLVGVEPSTGSISSTRTLSKPAFMKPVAAAGELLVLQSDGTLAAFR
ncbi:PQQ-like beta-propeller repeat protein [Faunimonas pinastri]|uniref:PQQ-like beta-propeller repeat protein n=1 Tax=Faunimonas pinastri TaxID=1855383 RepID=UPI0015A62541|nr:PQQ-like beta-propeller repeat protein [Faunimonas pinastri]